VAVVTVNSGGGRLDGCPTNSPGVRGMVLVTGNVPERVRLGCEARESAEGDRTCSCSMTGVVDWVNGVVEGRAIAGANVVATFPVDEEVIEGEGKNDDEAGIDGGVRAGDREEAGDEGETGDEEAGDVSQMDDSDRCWWVRMRRAEGLGMREALEMVKSGSRCRGPCPGPHRVLGDHPRRGFAVGVLVLQR